AIFLLFFMYRDGDRLSAWLVAGTRRIVGPATPELLETAQHTVVGVMLGVVGTALAQAMVALLGFMIAGVPTPFLLGALTF
ncbi:UNVERIFIED_CONTAM: AI-2E family transporter, partial [Salmonella enterica subsp. enterica serovar Weltevreden]